MPTLAVFTVKQFRYVNGRYWTYGGFGDYLRSLVPHFDKIILACHPKSAAEPPTGWYPVDFPSIEFAWLPFYTREDECLRKLPRMFWQSKEIVNRADIVNARVPDYSGVCGAYWARRAGRPLFINIVGDWSEYADDPPTRLRGLMREALRAHFRVYCYFEKRACKGALVFAQGEKLAERYRGHPDLRTLVSSSHSAEDVVAVRNVSENHAGMHIVSIGRLVAAKGHDLLIRALTRLNAGKPGISYRLSIAGDGPSRGEYERLAASLGAGDSVRFVGQLGRREVFDLLDSADLMCHPSLSEGTPKVLLEAMARGVPIVATDVGGVSTVVQEGITGLLVPGGDVDALVTAIGRLSVDGSLRQRLVDSGLVAARRHTSDNEWGVMMQTVKARFPDLDWNRTNSSKC